MSTKCPMGSHHPFSDIHLLLLFGYFWQLSCTVASPFLSSTWQSVQKRFGSLFFGGQILSQLLRTCLSGTWAGRLRLPLLIV